MSLAISVPGFAAEKESTSQLKNEVVLQRKTGTETIKLPTGISVSELTEMKNNIQKYGNQTLSQEEIAHINAKAAASGGLVYGPWFGGVSQYYAATLDEVLVFSAAIGGVLVSPFISDLGILSVSATKVTGKLVTAISLRYAIPGSVAAGQWVKATMVKQYREVKYSDGSFAYFQTGFFANNLNVANKSYGSPVAIFSGELD